MIGAMMFVKGIWKKPGVWNVEDFDPDPFMEPMSEGRLQQVMTYENGNLEVSPTWDGRNKKVTYMEAFGRLMAGLAPWLSLPDDDTAEGKQRRMVHTCDHQRI